MFNSYKDKANIKVLDIKAPSVFISKEAAVKMQAFIELCSDEIGWLGTAHTPNKGTYVIDDVLLFKQEVNATTTEITPEGLTEFANELVSLPNGVDLWNSIRVWGHSHVNMAPSPSGQDDKQMNIFSENQHDWFIRIIANKKGEMKIDLYDFEYGVIFEDLQFEVLPTEEEQEIYDKIFALEEQLQLLEDEHLKQTLALVQPEIEAKVKKKTYSMMSSSKSSNYFKSYGTGKQSSLYDEYKSNKNKYGSDDWIYDEDYGCFTYTGVKKNTQTDIDEDLIFDFETAFEDVDFDIFNSFAYKETFINFFKRQYGEKLFTDEELEQLFSYSLDRHNLKAEKEANI